MRLNRLRATAAEICPGTSRKFNTQVSSKSHSCYAPRRISPPSAAATRQFYQNKIITFRFEERSSRKRVRHRWHVKEVNEGGRIRLQSLSKLPSRIISIIRFISSLFSLHLEAFFPSI